MKYELIIQSLPETLAKTIIIMMILVAPYAVETLLENIL